MVPRHMSSTTGGEGDNQHSIQSTSTPSPQPSVSLNQTLSELKTLQESVPADKQYPIELTQSIRTQLKEHLSLKTYVVRDPKGKLDVDATLDLKEMMKRKAKELDRLLEASKNSTTIQLLNRAQDPRVKAAGYANIFDPMVRDSDGNRIADENQLLLREKETETHFEDFTMEEMRIILKEVDQVGLDNLGPLTEGYAASIDSQLPSMDAITRAYIESHLDDNDHDDASNRHLQANFAYDGTHHDDAWADDDLEDDEEEVDLTASDDDEEDDEDDGDLWEVDASDDEGDKALEGADDDDDDSDPLFDEDPVTFQDYLDDDDDDEIPFEVEEEIEGFAGFDDLVPEFEKVHYDENVARYTRVPTEMGGVLKVDIGGRKQETKPTDVTDFHPSYARQEQILNPKVKLSENRAAYKQLRTYMDARLGPFNALVERAKSNPGSIAAGDSLSQELKDVKVMTDALVEALPSITPQEVYLLHQGEGPSADAVRKVILAKLKWSKSKARLAYKLEMQNPENDMTSDELKKSLKEDMYDPSEDPFVLMAMKFLQDTSGDAHRSFVSLLDNLVDQDGAPIGIANSGPSPAEATPTSADGFSDEIESMSETSSEAEEADTDKAGETAADNGDENSVSEARLMRYMDMVVLDDSVANNPAFAQLMADSTDASRTGDASDSQNAGDDVDGHVSEAEFAKQLQSMASMKGLLPTDNTLLKEMGLSHLAELNEIDDIKGKDNIEYASEQYDLLGDPSLASGKSGELDELTLKKQMLSAANGDIFNDLVSNEQSSGTQHYIETYELDPSIDSQDELAGDDASNTYYDDTYSYNDEDEFNMLHAIDPDQYDINQNRLVPFESDCQHDRVEIYEAMWDLHVRDPAKYTPRYLSQLFMINLEAVQGALKLGALEAHMTYSNHPVTRFPSYMLPEGSVDFLNNYIATRLDHMMKEAEEKKEAELADEVTAADADAEAEGDEPEKPKYTANAPDISEAFKRAFRQNTHYVNHINDLQFDVPVGDFQDTYGENVDENDPTYNEMEDFSTPPTIDYEEESEDQKLVDNARDTYGDDTDIRRYAPEFEQTWDISYSPYPFQENQTDGMGYTIVDDGEDLMNMQDKARADMIKYFETAPERMHRKQSEYFAKYGPIGANKDIREAERIDNTKQRKQRTNWIMTDVSDVKNGNYGIAVRDKNGILREPHQKEYQYVRRREKHPKGRFVYVKHRQVSM